MRNLNVERKKYLIKYRQTKDKNALEFLVLSYIPSIESAALKYNNKGIELEDLISTGVVVTIETINKHIMTDKIKSLTSYIILALNYNFASITNKKLEIDNVTISYDRYKSNHKNGEEGFIDYTLFEEVLKNISVGAIEEILQTFTENQQFVLKSRYGLNNHIEYTQMELAEILNLSGTRIQQIEAKGIRKLKYPDHKNRLSDFV